ncbi:MAG: hypothetical protein OEM67_04820 [Thermoleophilia bacterium]|nr:hypothetical protein [Thermoleophilia bacterium]
MIPAISISIALVLVGLAAWGIALFALGRAPNRPFLVVAWIAVMELVLQTGAALIGIAAGHETESLPQFTGYALASLVLLPVVLRPGQQAARTRWDSISIGAVAIALAIAVLRMLSLW